MENWARKYIVTCDEDPDWVDRIYDDLDEAIADAKYSTRVNNRTLVVADFTPDDMSEGEDSFVASWGHKTWVTVHNGYIAVIDADGRLVDYEAAVEMMDDDIREDLHSTMAPCFDQDFYDAYVRDHYNKFGEEFEI